MLNAGSFFSGIGLLDYGLCLAGIEHRWLCESDEWRRSILAKRWPGVPVYSDVRDANAGWGRVDLVAGGFPCKGASTAGKREGFGHPETVLWREMRRAVGELRPCYVLVENVANILGLHGGRVWGEVLGDLAALGYDTVWDCLPAAAVGAPHRRDRVFAVATDTERGVHGRAGQGHVLGEAGAGEGQGPQRERVWVDAADGCAASSHADDAGRVERGGRIPRGAQLAAAERLGEAPTDAAGLGAGEPPDSADTVAGGGRARPEPASGVRNLATDAEGQDGQGARPGRAALGGTPGDRGVAWGEYEPAIRRWEAVHGPAPQPLVRRMDDRSAARVVRSRLSALGDGVQVQVGYLAGCYIRELEEGRLAA